MKLSLQSNLTLVPLVIREDNKHFIVENQLAGDYFEMPLPAVEAIRQIQSGNALADIEQDLQKRFPDEEIDMTSFIEQLLELQMIKEVDGKVIAGVMEANRQSSGFSWLPVQVGKLFFNRFTLGVYAIIILVNISILTGKPQLIPRYEDLFIFESMTFNLLIYMGISLVLILVHELGHILAIRAHNLPAKLEIGHRLFLVVFETDLTPAWKLAPRQRNTLYLAGIFFDQCIIFTALAASLWFSQGSELFLGILGIVILDLFIKTLYQCCFYMKTDLYYLIENISGCYNLMENSKNFLNEWIPFIKNRKDTEAFESEENAIKIYSLFYLSGVTLTLCLFGFYFVPQLAYALTYTLQALLHPTAASSFLDAAIFFAQIVLVFGLLLYSWRKTYKEKKSSFDERRSEYSEI